MKTRDLINVLVADRTAISPRPVFAVAIAVGVGTVISAVLLLSSIGIRPDLASAVMSPRFLAKFAIALSLAVGAVGLTARLSRPEASAGLWIWMLGAIPLFLTLAVAVELILAPASQWEARLFGAHWLACLALIPLFALPALAGILIALKRGAPRNGGLAGAIAGVAAGGIAATVYVLHCPDDSPLFVAAWYTLAICIVALLGFLPGRLWLKW
jgi:hypothetical protein